MKIIRIGVFPLFFLFVITAALAGEIRVVGVHFKANETGTTIKGSIKGREIIDYRLKAKAEQRMTVNLSTSNLSNYFNVLPPGSETALFVGSTHPLLGCGKVSLAELARYKWAALGPDDEGYLARRFGPYDIRAPDVPVKTNSSSVMKDLLLTTPMIGLAPTQLFAAETKLGELVALENELDPLSARGGIVRRKNAGRSPQLDAFIDDITATYQALLSPATRRA